MDESSPHSNTHESEVQDTDKIAKLPEQLKVGIVAANLSVVTGNKWWKANSCRGE